MSNIMSRILEESLKSGDLKDLVKPVIEIDTFKPKIDDKNIVVVLFVQDENPACDLSRFIEFSNKDILDTEVSPIPNVNGDYLVFVEFSKDNLAKKIYQMLKAVKYLSNNDEWIYKYQNRKAKLEVK